MRTDGHHGYEFTDWNLYRSNENTLIYRPSVRTLMRRLVYTLVAGTLFVLVHYLGRQVPALLDPGYVRNDPQFQARQQELSRQAEELRQSARDSMTEEQRTAYDAELERWQAEAEAQYVESSTGTWGERRQMVLLFRIAMWALSILLGAVATLPPLMALIEQFTVENDGRGNLAVTWRRFVTRTRACPVSDLGAMTITAGERVAQGRYGTRGLGYRWIVSVESALTGLRFEFHPDHQKHTPINGRHLPERVETFVQGLSRMTGLQIPAPVILDYQTLTPAFIAGQGVMSVRNKAEVTTHSYSMDEIPQELRGHVDALLAQAKSNPGAMPAIHTFTHGTFTYRDPNGQEHTYTSLEEMPPDVRALFERIRRETEGK